MTMEVVVICVSSLLEERTSLVLVQINSSSSLITRLAKQIVLTDNSLVEEKMLSVSRNCGDVMEKSIVEMDQMNQDQKSVVPESVLLENSNVTTTTVQDHSNFVMETTIVEMDLTKEIATNLVILGCSSVRIQENVFLVDSSVMEILIAVIVLMRQMKSVRTQKETVLPKNSDVPTTNALARLGNVTSKMIAEINPMKLLIVHLSSVQKDGLDVLAVTDASQIGHSVMDKMIAEMDLMKILVAALLVILLENSNVQRLRSVFLEDGYAILKTIVEITLMKPMENVEELQDLVVKANSDATMEDVFQQVKSVTE